MVYDSYKKNAQCVESEANLSKWTYFINAKINDSKGIQNWQNKSAWADESGTIEDKMKVGLESRVVTIGVDIGWFSCVRNNENAKIVKLSGDTEGIQIFRNLHAMMLELL